MRSEADSPFLSRALYASKARGNLAGLPTLSRRPVMGHDNGQPDASSHGKSPRGASQDSEDVKVCNWRSSLVRIQQAQALVDAPLSTGQPIPPRPSMRDGLLYGLHDLLAPLDSVMQMQGTSAQGLAAAITADPSTNTTPSQGLLSFAQSASSMLNMAERVKAMLNEPLNVTENTDTAFGALEKERERAPLKCRDERDIILRMRKKRRQLSNIPIMSKSREGTDTSELALVRSPLQPMPNSLTFEATTSWVDDVVERNKQTSPTNAVHDLIQAFQIYVKEHCRREALVLTDAQVMHPFPALRVRARLAMWSGMGGSFEVELRDIGLVAIQVQVVQGDVQITSIGMRAPSEYKHATPTSLLPSRYINYGDLSNHLLVHALSREHDYGRGLKALAHTLLHIAGLRTLYDPLPVLATSVAPTLSRVTIGTLGWNATIDREQCVVWKWCRVVAPTPSPHGEWCAYAPSLL